MKTAYAVVGSTHHYEEHEQWIVAAYDDEKSAITHMNVIHQFFLDIAKGIGAEPRWSEIAGWIEFAIGKQGGRRAFAPDHNVRFEESGVKYHIEQIQFQDAIPQLPREYTENAVKAILEEKAKDARENDEIVKDVIL